VRAWPEFRPVSAVLALIMDGADENGVNQVIQRDPDNALGYYVQANLLYGCDRDDEALEAFRKGAHCSELRLYESSTGPAIFKALDALNVEGRERLCALSWMACRASNFSSSVMQFLSLPLTEWGQRTAAASRQEIAELLLVLAGHLFATNFYNRWAARQALDHAVFGLNASVPAMERFSVLVGAGAVTQGLIAAMLRWPPVNVAEQPGPLNKDLRLAQFLPDQIRRAFAATDPTQMAALGEMNFHVSASRKAVLERAREQFIQGGRTLIDSVLTDTDGIMGPYLKGILLSRRSADGRQVVPFETDVEKLFARRPDVFAAAAANQQALNAIWDAEAGDPARRNITRMMEINQAMHSYAATHDNTYPNNIDVLFETGYLQATVKAKSLLTGKPYVFPAAGEKVPAKSKDKWRFIVLYDDNPDQWGCYQCVFASWVGGGMRVEEVKEQLAKRGRS